MEKKPVVIDLFAGAGGLSLGAAYAGFRVAAAVELDPHAMHTHSKNFPNSIHSETDVSTMTGNELLELAKLQPGQLDGLIGGPPCQGFSSMGKRDADDTRNNLFGHFFRLVNEARPRFFVAENVPGIMDSKFDDIREKAFSEIKEHYEIFRPLMVRANEYGAPTIRTRYFFIGYDKSSFPNPPVLEDFFPTKDTPIITVEKALAALPVDIDPLWQKEEHGWKKIEKKKKNSYVKILTDEIPEGVGDLETINRLLKNGEVSGCLGTRHLLEVVARFNALEPGQSDRISKSPRLDPKGFCPTLRAGTGKEKGSFQAVRPIHPSCPRVITPREAARLQGFPDWFIFHATKWHSFRQIGNSVSPIVAKKILSVLSNKLNNYP